MQYDKSNDAYLREIYNKVMYFKLDEWIECDMFLPTVHPLDKPCHLVFNLSAFVFKKHCTSYFLLA